MWYEGTTHLLRFDRVYIAFSLALFHWLKPFTNRREETGVPFENP